MRAFALFAAVLLAALPVRGQDFDYYLLALSWSPSWCKAEGRAEGAEQCAPGRDFGFTLHGLWPQFEDGWPEFCPAAAGDPARSETAAMADIMGSGGLAWYQWRKHGRCSGLAPRDYFALARAGFGALRMPELDAGSTTADAVEDAFLDANPGLAAADLIVTCREGRVEEVRICLDRGLAPRACADDVERRACSAQRPLDVPPVR